MCARSSVNWDSFLTVKNEFQCEMIPKGWPWSVNCERASVLRSMCLLVVPVLPCGACASLLCLCFHVVHVLPCGACATLSAANCCSILYVSLIVPYLLVILDPLVSGDANWGHFRSVCSRYTIRRKDWLAQDPKPNKCVTVTMQGSSHLSTITFPDDKSSNCITAPLLPWQKLLSCIWARSLSLTPDSQIACQYDEFHDTKLHNGFAAESQNLESSVLQLRAITERQSINSNSLVCQ